MKQNGYESAINWAVVNSADVFDIKKGGQFNVVLFWKIKDAVQRIQRGRKLDNKKTRIVEDITPQVEDLDAESKVLKNQYLEAVGNALEDISKEDRVMLTMRYVLGLPATEIAQKFDFSKATIHTRLNKACKNLEMQVLENLNFSTDYRFDVRREALQLMGY